jgi:hypothetical protein
MNHGNLATSYRLQATLSAIRDWASTREISTRTGSMAVHSDVAGLRENGIVVDVRRVPRAGDTPLYFYRERHAGVEQGRLAI